MKKVVKKIFRWFAYAGYLTITVLILLELIFRFQVVDFYYNELNALNPGLENPGSKKNILVFGDSFTANPTGYVQYLRKAFPAVNFINTAVPGTGIRQHLLFASRRISEFSPDAVIYQFYAGNDLTDIRHPVSFSTLSPARNLFWIISERFLVVQFINRKLAAFKPAQQTIQELHQQDFDPGQYNARSRLYFRADKRLLLETILLEGEKKEVYETWAGKFKEFLALVPEKTSVYLLVIPHCAQTGEIYKNRMAVIGAEVNDSIVSGEYPLITQMKNDFPDIHILNPLFNFQQSCRENQMLYYSNDPHLNDNGQEVLGDFLENKLRSLR